MNKEEKNMMKLEELFEEENLYWTKNLEGFLSMTDAIMRFYGDDEEVFKEHIAEYMWAVVQKNLNEDTKPRHENEVEHCGTFPKWKGEPGISHLIADAYPRGGPHVDAFKAYSSRQSSQE